MGHHSKQVYFGKKPLVLKTAVIEAARNKSLIIFRTKQYDKTVPCQVPVSLDPTSLKDGFVWVVIESNERYGKMRFMVPKEAVLVRYKFMRPMVPLSLDNEIKYIEDRIIALGKIAKEELRKLNVNSL